MLSAIEAYADGISNVTFVHRACLACRCSCYSWYNGQQRTRLDGVLLDPSVETGFVVRILRCAAANSRPGAPARGLSSVI